jgi:hypothetical protein
MEPTAEFFLGQFLGRASLLLGAGFFGAGTFLFLMKMMQF